MNHNPFCGTSVQITRMHNIILDTYLTGRASFGDAISMVPIDMYPASDFKYDSTSMINIISLFQTESESEPAYAFRGCGRDAILKWYTVNIWIHLEVLPHRYTLFVAYFNAS